ncbi:MAG: hypothetical protein GC185_08815 [Alphaproteobacteria bacterium]|nr:hypothetical protein [Alphaproteobacteria bacterium]
MGLPYKEEYIDSPDGTRCKVLDVAAVDFSGAAQGRKATETLVRCAQGGERIETKNTKGKIESVYTARKGDAIFTNLHNPDDVYVPGNTDGTRWQFSALESKGYEITADDYEHGGVRVKSTKTASLLQEAVREPSCIKDAWGAGQHQFLFTGATLKVDDKGHVTGIDKKAFDATWEITSSPPARPAAQGQKAQRKPS